MKFCLVTLAFLAAKLNAAPVAIDEVEMSSPDAPGAHFRGDDADQAYHTITPHPKDHFRGDDADQVYHTITPHRKDHFRGDDADQVYHTIIPHPRDVSGDHSRGDDGDQVYHTITPHPKDHFRGDDADQVYHTITPHDEPFAKETHVYVPRQTTDISLDVYTSKQGQMPSPIMLWFHGGYLITGSRIAIPDWLLNFAYDQGWTVVSPDYRVLPESTGLATIEDLQSAYRWVAKELPCIHRECDANRIILAGASAGGWCAVVNAMLVTDPASCAGLPLPRALFLIYPIVDIGSEKWAKSFTIPDSHVDSETKHHLLQDIPLRIARREASLGEDFPTSEEELKTRKRLPLLYSVMEEGRLLDYLTGLSGFAARRMASGLERTILRDPTVQKLFPLSCAFSSEYPSTVIVHGTADRGVSSEESETLLQKLQSAGLAAQYFPESGADHAFDIGWEEPNDTMRSALRALQGIVCNK
ncbi:hypothetical protein NLG97_g8995 [Lecanicillium saksenae]|uniref:Uncharacterized protein n=1 Tax=Lecanicillium saksenae TaxID=468837 RepID=A0ACC1QIJ5_9HYPO|nr:hypothetical protein NLG97_g8995 [Lecanicillium saksenae]